MSPLYSGYFDFKSILIFNKLNLVLVNFEINDFLKIFSLNYPTLLIAFSVDKLKNRLNRPRDL